MNKQQLKRFFRQIKIPAFSEYKLLGAYRTLNGNSSLNANRQLGKILVLARKHAIALSRQLQLSKLVAKLRYVLRLSESSIQLKPNSTKLKPIIQLR